MSSVGARRLGKTVTTFAVLPRSFHARRVFPSASNMKNRERRHSREAAVADIIALLTFVSFWGGSSSIGRSCASGPGLA